MGLEPLYIAWANWSVGVWESAVSRCGGITGAHHRCPAFNLASRDLNSGLTLVAQALD